MSIAMIGSKGLSVCHSGLEAHVRELADQLGLLGNKVTVYGYRNHRFDLMPSECVPKTNVEDREGFWLKGKLTATISNSVWATVDAIRSGRFDVFHYHGVGCVFGLLLARRMGCPTVLSLHSTNWQEKKWSGISQILIHRLERLAVHAADKIVVVSQALAHRITAEYDVTASVIPNGVHIKGRPESDEEVLRSLSLQKNRFLLYVGRIVPDKGCHVVAEAVRKAEVPVKLALIGPHQDKAYAERIIAGQQSIVAPGALQETELGALYRSCWAFCSASISEGQPIALMEALAHGATCLVSDIPSHHELVTEPSMRFSVDDVQSLRDKLTEMHAMKKPVTACGSNWLEQHPQYLIENTARRVLDIYKRANALNVVNRPVVVPRNGSDEAPAGTSKP